MKILPQANPCSRCGHDVCAKKVSLFSTLTEEELRGVLDLILRRFIHKGESVATEGEPSDSLIIVNRGSLKIHSETRDGREQFLYLLQEGEFIGDLNLLKSGTYSFSVSALEDTHICTIRKSDFDTLIRRTPDISLKLLAYAHDRITALEAMIQTLTLKDADARLSSFLYAMAEKNKTSPAGILEFTLPLSREEVAAAIGLTRETVSRKLGQLTSEGIISIIDNRRIRVLNVDALKERGEIR